MQSLDFLHLILSKIRSLIFLTMNFAFRNTSNLCRLVVNRFFCSKTIPRNTIEHIHGSQAHHENGVVYDKKPFKMHLKAETKYAWCLCGRGKSQPLCDSTHNYVHYKIKQRPVRFQVTHYNHKL